MSAPLFACVDLGTNTFHLLIGRWQQGALEVVYRERHFVKVAGDGIETIGPEPFQRALAAARALGAALGSYQWTSAVAFGTAALRTASNGPELQAQLAECLGLPIQIIDGRREAELIAKGVLAAGLPPDERYLIMDIGGGSVEFILIEDGEASFSESYPIGAAVLRRLFHQAEPFRNGVGQPSAQEADLFGHLEETLQTLIKAARQGAVLVGASGTFDVLGSLFGERVNDAVSRVAAQRVVELYNEAAVMTALDRLSDARLPNDRADMIVVALALIVYVLRQVPQTAFLTCDYALKEGALLELSETHVAQ